MAQYTCLNCGTDAQKDYDSQRWTTHACETCHAETKHYREDVDF